MDKEQNDGIVRHADLNFIANKDNLDNEVFIFNDIDGVAIEASPIKLEMPIFAVCTQGNATMQVNLKEYFIPANSLVTLMPDHILHGYSHSDDFKGIFIGISSSFAEDMLPEIHSVLPLIMSFKTNPVISLTEDEAESFKEFHAFLWKRIHKAKGNYRRKVIQGLLQSLLYETLTIYTSHYNYTKTKRSRNDEIFYNFVTLVEHDFKKDRSVQYYADHLNITSKHLTTVVRMVSGRTAGDWINSFVILAAKVLLRSSSHTVQEVSIELNFANQSFFGKYFKQHVGVSPSSYRSMSSLL